MFQAVALDGTYYQKSGLISGGTADLARKAKQWDDKQVAQMQAQKVNSIGAPVCTHVHL